MKKRMARVAGLVVSVLLAGSAVMAGAPVTLIYADESPEASTRAQAMMKYAEWVKERSNGTLIIDDYYAGTLGPARESLEMMQEGGTVDMVITVEPLSYWLTDVNVLSVPYLFDNEEHAEAFAKSEVCQELLDKILKEANVRGLASVPTDPRIMTSNKPIRGLDDLKGLVLRVPETLTGPLAFEAMGCKVTTMPWSEVFTALQQGVIEAQENALTFMQTYSLYEVQSHASMTNHSITMPFLFISEKSWQKLSPEHQKILADTAMDMRAYEKELRVELLKNCMEFLKEKGVVIIENPDREAIAAAAASAYEKYPEVIREWIAKIKEIPY